jgi:hypothetical protein
VIAFLGYIGSSIALWVFFRGVKPPEELIAQKGNRERLIKEEKF